MAKKPKPEAVENTVVRLEDVPQPDQAFADEPLVVKSAAKEPEHDNPTISGASEGISVSYGLASALTTSAKLELAIIEHMDRFGKEVTSEQLKSIADEMLN